MSTALSRRAFDFDLLPQLFNFTLRIDQEGTADNPIIFAAIHFFLLPDTIFFQYRLLWIAEQGNFQIMLGSEFGMTINRVRTDPQNNGIQFLELLDFVSKIKCFPGTTRGIIPGIKIEYNPLTAVV